MYAQFILQYYFLLELKYIKYYWNGLLRPRFSIEIVQIIQSFKKIYQLVLSITVNVNETFKLMIN